MNLPSFSPKNMECFHIVESFCLTIAIGRIHFLLKKCRELKMWSQIWQQSEKIHFSSVRFCKKFYYFFKYSISPKFIFAKVFPLSANVVRYNERSPKQHKLSWFAFTALITKILMRASSLEIIENNRFERPREQNFNNVTEFIHLKSRLNQCDEYCTFLKFSAIEGDVNWIRKLILLDY